MIEKMGPPPGFVSDAVRISLLDESFGAYSQHTIGSHNLVMCYEWSVLKSGKRGKRLIDAFRDWRRVSQCSRCGVFRRSSAIGVMNRWHCPKLFQDGHSQIMLCVGCNNKLRALTERFIAADKTRLLCNSMKSKINEATKNATRTDGGPVLHHGGGDQR